MEDWARPLLVQTPSGPDPFWSRPLPVQTPPGLTEEGFPGAARTVLGLAGAVVGLGEVALHAGAGVRPVGVGTGLAAGPVHTALIEVCGRGGSWLG